MSNEEQQDTHVRRWRLILGGGEADGIGISLQGADLGMDRALQALYNADGTEGNQGHPGKSKKRTGGLSSSAPNVARWLEDIRGYFPSSVVRVMQQDALNRLGLRQMLLEPELLEAVEPDVQLVATLISLSNIIPNKTKETARRVVRKVVEELERKLANPLRQAVQGSLNRSVRNNRPRHSEMDWNRTIRANLRHYQPEYKTIIPVRKIGFGRKTSSLRDIILAVDESGSMASSVVYSSVMAAVLASVRSVKTHMVVFDTSVVDLTPLLQDPVEVLFGTQLGGGTDIHLALSYCQGLVRNPQDTILVLISDLYEGGDRKKLIKRAASLIASGVQIIVLLALDDRGAPSFDHQIAGILASFGVPCFACTPDLFPDLMASAIQRRNLSQWAATQGIVAARAEAPEIRSEG